MQLFRSRYVCKIREAETTSTAPLRSFRLIDSSIRRLSAALEVSLSSMNSHLIEVFASSLSPNFRAERDIWLSLPSICKGKPMIKSSIGPRSFKIFNKLSKSISRFFVRSIFSNGVAKDLKGSEIARPILFIPKSIPTILKRIPHYLKQPL